MFGAQGNADAGCDIDLVAFYREWPGDDFNDAICKRARGFALIVFAVLNDREFVASQPGQYVGFPE